MTLHLTKLARHAAAAAAVGAAACGDSFHAPITPVLTAVTINGSTVSATIAATRASREQGLMGVQSLGANSGMLFVFADDRQRFFWMKDTGIPLSIAFIDLNKKIVLIEDMVPNTLTSHGGPQMRYALEVNQGWFASHGITAGMFATFTAADIFIESDP